MRFVPLVTGAAVAALITSAVLIAPASAATVANYAALGDSYSSGVGTGQYYKASGSCHQSPESYPVLWSTAHNVTNFDFAACSGAKTSDVIANQLGGLSSATNVVTITIGGNDAGFSSVMTSCIEDTDAGCNTAVTNAENYATNTLPGLLDTTYSDIRSHAANAAVYVLGYPRFYQLNGSCTLGLDDTKRGYINNGADTLDTVISAQVAKYSGFHFVDVRSAFSTHEICSTTGASWLNSVDWLDISESYHPTTNGYKDGYLPTLTTATG